MPTKNRFFSLVAFLAPVLASGCLPSSAFRDATSAFAGAAQKSASSLQGEFDTAGELCRRRAELDFLGHRMSGASSFAWGSEPLWSDWSAQANIKAGGQSGTWKEHCARLSRADELQKRGLAVLGAYGQALAALTATGNFDGSDVATAVGEAANIASQLSHDKAASSTIRSFASGLGGVLSQFSAQLVQALTAHKMMEVVVAADPIVEKMVAAMNLYVDATDEELLDYGDRVQAILITWEKHLAPPPAEAPAAVIAPPLTAVKEALPIAPLAKTAGKKRFHRRGFKGARAALAMPVSASPATPPAISAPAPAPAPVSPPPPPLPVSETAVAFYHFAVQTDAEMRTYTKNQAQYHRLLGDLRTAHKELTAAASSEPVIADRLKRVMGLTGGMLTTLGSLHEPR